MTSTRGADGRTRLGWLRAVPWLLVLGVVALPVLDVADVLARERPATLEALRFGLRGREDHPDEVLRERVDHPVVALGPEDAAVVWVLGGSSVVSPRRELATASLHEAFEAAGVSLRVRNLGVPGADLGLLGPLLRWRLEHGEAPPDVLLLHAGHNEYTNAYQTWDYEGPMYRTLALAYLATGFGFAGRVPDDLRNHFAWYRRTHAVSWLDGLQRVGLWAPDPAFWSAYAAHVDEAWVRRLDQVLDLCAAHGVDVVLELPASNLAWAPHGFLHRIEALRAEAARTEDLARRTALQREARDLEIHTADVRAKRSLLDATRRVAADRGIPVFAVGDALVAEGIALDGDVFSDALHYTEAGHAAHHARLAAWWVAQGLPGSPVAAAPSGQGALPGAPPGRRSTVPEEP